MPDWGLQLLLGSVPVFLAALLARGFGRRSLRRGVLDELEVFKALPEELSTERERSLLLSQRAHEKYWNVSRDPGFTVANRLARFCMLGGFVAAILLQFATSGPIKDPTFKVVTYIVLATFCLVSLANGVYVFVRTLESKPKWLTRLAGLVP